MFNFLCQLTLSLIGSVKITSVSSDNVPDGGSTDWAVGVTGHELSTTAVTNAHVTALVEDRIGEFVQTYQAVGVVDRSRLSRGGCLPCTICKKGYIGSISEL